MAMFARYDGVTGESQDADHDEWIDVLSLDWGAYRPESGSTGQSRRRGAAVIEDLVITVEYEKATPKLLEKCLKGEVVPKLDIELTTTFGGARATYLKYELKNVMVTSYQVSAFGDDEAGPPTVVIGNNFEEIKVTYTEFSDDGSTAGNVEAEHKVERSTAGPKKAKEEKKKKKRIT
jgi:type VI secretion system secreted protein Hcp